MRVTTPSEFRPYGWTTTDLWSAPLITGLYALLTHAQPFWADMHALAFGFLGAEPGQKVESVDPETARAMCLVVLMGLFMSRAVRTYGSATKTVLSAPKTKTKVQ